MKISKGLYLGSILGGLGGCIIFAILTGVFAASRSVDEAAPVFAGLAVLSMLYGGIMWMVFLYKIWAALPFGSARTTPGQAVGFLFIPFFNLYWQFVAIAGFPKDYNALADRQNLNVPRLSEGLFLTSPILVCCSIIPLLGYLAALANLILIVIIVAKASDAVNALPDDFVDDPVSAVAQPVGA